MTTVVGPDGLARCGWGAGDDLYRRCHDEEWGRASDDDRELFEKLVLEGFQSGLAWITILRKRERFREVFAGFEPEDVAGFGEADVARLLADPGIVRHRGKIEAAISNAGRVAALREEYGSLAAYVWGFAPGDRPAPAGYGDLAAQIPESRALAADLKRRGWRFVGPTTVYAFMQAMGLVNDHMAGCWARAECEGLRRTVLAGRTG